MKDEYDEIRAACDENIASAMRRVAELKAQLAAAQAEIATLRVNAEKWRSYEMSKNQANKECGK